MTAFREITTGLRFPEGPVPMPDGSILVVELAGGMLTGVAPGGAKTVVAAPAAARTAPQSDPTAAATSATAAGCGFAAASRG